MTSSRIVWASLSIGLLLTAAAAHAQDRVAPGAEKIRSMLVQPTTGWTANYRHISEKGQVGAVDIVFEARDEKVMAKIRDVVHGRSCEREVTITSDAVRYDGCADSGITLHFDPDDQQYPLKGSSKTGNDYKLQRK